MMQMSMFATATPNTIAAGTAVTYRGQRGIVEIVDPDTYAATMLIVKLTDGRTAVLKPSEVEIGHALSWTCGCDVCVTARKTLGRAFR